MVVADVEEIEVVVVAVEEIEETGPELPEEAVVAVVKASMETDLRLREVVAVVVTVDVVTENAEAEAVATAHAMTAPLNKLRAERTRALLTTTEVKTSNTDTRARLVRNITPWTVCQALAVESVTRERAVTVLEELVKTSMTTSLQRLRRRTMSKLPKSLRAKR